MHSFEGTSSSRSDYPKYDVASVSAASAPVAEAVAEPRAKKPMEFSTSSV